MSKDQRIALRITSELRNNLLREMGYTGITLSALIHKILDENFSRRR